MDENSETLQIMERDLQFLREIRTYLQTCQNKYEAALADFNRRKRTLQAFGEALPLAQRLEDWWGPYQMPRDLTYDRCLADLDYRIFNLEEARRRLVQWM